MSKEIYPRPPVQFVSFGVEFPLSPTLQAPGLGKEAVYDRLRERFPLLEGLQSAQIEVPAGAGAVIPPTMGSSPPRQLRMTSRERMSSVTIGPRMVRFDCTDHESFEQLQERVRPVVEAVEEVAAPTGLLEVTLQYINEIRHPAAVEPEDWTRFVVEPVVGPVDLLGAAARQTAGVAVYETSDREQLRIGYGAVREGFAVDPKGPLRVRSGESGPFFRLGFESEWSTPEDAVPTFDSETVLDTAQRLHRSINDAFEALIKPELRAYFKGDDDATIGVLHDRATVIGKALEHRGGRRRDVGAEQLREAAASHGRQDPKELIQSLVSAYGLSWQTVATMLNVTPTAIRKWRRGGSVTPANREQVNALAAFFEQLGDLDIADLGGWIEMRVREDTTLTPAEIYKSGSAGRSLLLDWAREDIDTVTMLERFDARWRERYAPDPNFRVVRGPDGERAIVPR